ncbi:RloB family protein [Diaminobutyricimonas sp. LJ205]|uniref:RloB family protein n=1 Tax=Diaminobutyricimonas sp. LJ205 TaxID=2683590 RepID=UPI0012F4D891|nr:RloB family protein [Diaminobutyricimonas sp. LJ205]
MGGNGRRRRPIRSLYRRILVVAEGKETERQYIELLGQHLRERGVMVSVKTAHGGSDPVAVVRKCVSEADKARKKQQAFDQYVCLVDVDTHAHLDDAVALAQKNDVVLIVTNLKFEVWLLWHVEDSISTKTSKELDELVIKHGLVKKDNPKHLTVKFPIDKWTDADTIARRADPDLASCRKGADPSSAMPVLVEILRGQS